MAETAHLAWYRQGTVSVADGSPTVTGHETNFLSAGINQGAAFRIDNRFYVAEIKRVVSDTELELATAYYGGTVSNASYSIDRNHQSTLPAVLAARLAKAMGNWEARYDLDMQTITGKSAYDVAVENGFTGTEAAWLESLKAAGEWSTLNERTEPLTYRNAYAHNSYYRGKNLGTAITAAQIAAIRNGTYEDIYPGDYWELPIDGTTTATIMGCGVGAVGYDNQKRLPNKNIILWLNNSNWNYPINDTDTTEGHLYNSKLFNETLPALLAKIEAVIPADYIKTLTDNIADSIDANGMPNHRTLTDMRIFLPSAQNLNIYETNAFTHSAYSLSDKNVWPYFTHRPPSYWFACWIDANSTTSYWFAKAPQLRGIVPTKASSNFPCCPYVYIG